jgi:hypothetical protein
MQNTSQRYLNAVAVAVVFVVLSVQSVFAISHIYGFEAGIDTTLWQVLNDTALYTVDDSQGTVHISKPVGGDYTLQTLHVRFRPVVVGDFDVFVQYRAAHIDRADGRPGNQVQLNAVFGGQTFSVVRSDEIWVGHNYHVWEKPPEVWQGGQSDTTSWGTLRITRVGTTVTGYVKDALIYSADYSADDVTFFSFSLQNNGTTDSTSVTFDNFYISADSLIMSVPSGMDGHAPPPVSIDVSPNPFRSGTHIEYTLGSAGNVRLSVYDVAGRRIAHLDMGRRDPGAYAVYWDGHDGSGAPVPSGVYFATLTFEGRVFTRKMTVLR